MDDDTLTAAIIRLRARGYSTDLIATPDGYLVCVQCNTVEDPATMQVDHSVRFEGDSDPGDEAVLLAVSCQCGARGLYSAAYSPTTPPADRAVLSLLAAHRRGGRA